MAAAKEYTMEDLKQHTSRSDIWITIEKKVYNVTPFLDEHPGGDEVLLEEAGRDATEAFEDVGHSDEARAELKKLYVGNLKGPLPSGTTKSANKSASSSESGGGMSYLVPVLILVGAYVAWRVYFA